MMKAVGGYGLEIQNDLEDAVKYLIDQKIADPNRYAFAGASYGGYTALVGATKTPDLFKCVTVINF
jgi:dipeptidyl aminopeptidase/acylaminoacyl peptidase